MKKNKLFNFVLAALFAALIAVFSQISLKLGDIPFTLQTFAVALCAYTIGVKFSTISIATYLVIGAIGIPVFANFRGGISVLFGATGGFLIGFFVMAICFALTYAIKNIPLKIVVNFAGLIGCHLLGTIWFMILSNVGFIQAITVTSLPFLLKDIVSMVLAYLIANRLRKVIYKNV